MFLPKYRFKSIYDIDADFLVSLGIKGIVLDIDNTLVFYGEHQPTAENIEWIRAVEARDIKICFVSNGYKERVTEFNEQFGYYYSYKSGKPRKGGFLKAADALSLKVSEMAVIGDQLFTDILGANNAGMISIMVEPIKLEPWLSFKIKRFFEKIILK